MYDNNLKIFLKLFFLCKLSPNIPFHFTQNHDRVEGANFDASDFSDGNVKDSCDEFFLCEFSLIPGFMAEPQSYSVSIDINNSSLT